MDSNESWEVTESYWNAHGDECIAVTVKEARLGKRVDWKKHIHLRLPEGKERVLTLVQDDESPRLDSYMIVDSDEFIATLNPERDGFFPK